MSFNKVPKSTSISLLVSFCHVSQIIYESLRKYVGYKDAEPDETMSWDNILKRTIATDEEHVLKVVRSLIYYMDTVPMSQRSAIFTESFIRRCAFKIVDLVQKLEDFKF